MFVRMAVGLILASWIVFGATTSAWGQVEFLAQIEEIPTADDRYGDYEPAEFASDGPLLLPPARNINSQNLVVAQAAPLPNPTRGEDVLPAPVVSPPVTSAPVMIPYAAPQPVYAPPAGHHCSPWRPCGPQQSFGMNWLMPQGFAGADFRPACASHDVCLATGCFPRKVCDKAFLYGMDNACNYSKFPVLCRLEARKCYLGVRLFGWMF